MVGRYSKFVRNVAYIDGTLISILEFDRIAESVKKGFYAKVFDYIFDKRMDLFQAMFYKLYEDFKGDKELFLKAWFEDHAKRKLLEYFPLWDLLEYYL
ncbi:MAG: hypothetical protein ACO2PP_25825 [Thermocrinis sp.]|jgi:hypothetical protein|uniref:hypothetical protein n=1 Tax=Thermocrinis sp. TaxID=2024383 RepID=UPI003C12776F